mmetsp:Transcript_50132/g.93816  ORF Transcript_50132/g.93816 Transcript_50132/m.93816 type:complete len:705 (+) Transcript_50132:55-2169(+)
MFGSLCPFLLLLAVSKPAQGIQRRPHKVLQIEGREFVLGQDGPPVRIHAGEMHYFRVPEVYWRDRLQRLRALGLNTVSTYVAWNWHERKEGEFDFESEGKNVVKFLQLAKQEGLYVIFRAGPYICAEWEFGGLPAWLLKYVRNSGMRFRSSDKLYLSFVDRFWNKLLPKIRTELQENGGAVAMVQIENELGAMQYDNKPDYAYMQHLQKLARKHLGEKVILISTDNTKGAVSVPGVLQAVNLGAWQDNPKEHLEWTLAPARKANGGSGPDFVMELWAGWFQMWHQSDWDEAMFRQSASRLSNYVKELLVSNMSFTLYMAHGGTNFGAWSSGTTVMKGPFESQAEHSSFLQTSRDDAVHMSFVTTSYDYAAPISEEGRHGLGGDGLDKFDSLRSILSEHRAASEGPVPKEPDFIPMAAYPGDDPDGTVTLYRRSHLRDPTVLQHLCAGGWQEGPPQPMEMHGQQLGMVLYRFQQPTAILMEGKPEVGLSLKGKDRLTVWHGDKLVTDSASNLLHGGRGRSFHSLTTAPLKSGQLGNLDVLVENLGRRAYFCTADYGFLPDFFNDWKGLAEVPLLGGSPLEGDWSYCAIELEDLYKFEGSAPPSSTTATGSEPGPAFFEGSLFLEDNPHADTFLRFDAGSWTTGSAYVNGFHLGRYWREARGHFDLYVPKSKLVKGANHVVLLEMDPSEDVINSVSFSETRSHMSF